ncbi:hypothetical protein ACFL96_02435 [Thermoproteota archaeon]
MKKTITVVVAFVIILFTVNLAYSHPPAQIKMAFNIEQCSLVIGIAHSVEVPKEHFIAKVVVKLNGDVVVIQKILKQDNQNGQSLAYKIPSAELGDTIEVEAYCNKSGMLDSKLRLTHNISKN